MHSRSAFSRWGHNGVQWLREHVDPNAYTIKDPSKYKYVMVLDKSLQPMLDKMAKPYPKRRQDSSEPSANQADEGGAAPTQALQ